MITFETLNKLMLTLKEARKGKVHANHQIRQEAR